MRCRACGTEDTRVIDSRTSADAIRRRRECNVCGSRFTTFEREALRPMWVVKRDGDKQPFDRVKLARGVALACRKRPVGPEAIERIVDEVVDHFEASRETEIPSRAVGEAVMDELRTVDEVAYVRFASVYQAFESVDQFIDAIAPLREQG